MAVMEGSTLHLMAKELGSQLSNCDRQVVSYVNNGKFFEHVWDLLDHVTILTGFLARYHLVEDDFYTIFDEFTNIKSPTAIWFNTYFYTSISVHTLVC